MSQRPSKKSAKMAPPPDTNSDSRNEEKRRPQTRPATDIRHLNKMKKMATRDEFMSLLVLSMGQIFSIICAPIQDCDETFNYLEPIHYLLHGYGNQTWEWSPEFSIRSWLYACLYAYPTMFFSSFHNVFKGTNKFYEFYVLRALTGSFAVYSQWKLLQSLRFKAAGTFWLAVFITASSTGNFIAGTSVLPNTFVLHCGTLALAYSMELESVSALTKAFSLWAIAIILGWPFAGVLGVPFLALYLYPHWTEKSLTKAVSFALALVFGLSLLVFEIGFDSSFTRRLHSVPFNIIEYNVFGGKDKGPNIYGTEPWHFFFKNLVLNFNLVFFLALLNVPLRALEILGLLFEPGSSGHSRDNHLLTIAWHTQFPLWLSLFTVVSHKEERFMYPVYPFLVLAAVRVIDDFLSGTIYHITTGWTSNQHLRVVRHLPRSLTFSPMTRARIAYGITLVAAGAGIARSWSLSTAYTAPLSIYHGLPDPPPANLTVCLGKEWHRFPSSFFLPSLLGGAHTTRLAFISSSFGGLLPGSFEPNLALVWPPPGAHVVPPGMNDRNDRDEGKLVPLARCDFLVDSALPSAGATAAEPAFVGGVEGWKRVRCAPFLDAGATGLVGRVGWVPGWRRVWGEYCLLGRVGKE